MLTYIGEKNAAKLNILVDDLKDPNRRIIRSGFSYWGLGPSLKWNSAAKDTTYHMRENIRDFGKFVDNTFSNFSRENSIR